MQKRADSYFDQRASEEMRCAAKAQHPQAMIAHQQLAALFLRAAQGSTPSLDNRDGRFELDMGEASREQGFRLYGSR